MELSENNITVYDPLSGIKKKSFNKKQLGMYCKPIGSYKDEFQKYEVQYKIPESRDIWDQFEHRGKLLYDFILQHNKFNPVFNKCISKIENLPAFQKHLSSSDCAPISLFITLKIYLYVSGIHKYPTSHLA